MPPHSELRRFGAWALTGVANTALHATVVAVLVEMLAVPPVPANGAAFVTANLFSFWANSRYTFATGLSRQRYARFLAVSLVGLLIALGASGLAVAMRWHYAAGVVLTMLALPLLTYLAHRYWTWGPGR